MATRYAPRNHLKTFSIPLEDIKAMDTQQRAQFVVGRGRFDAVKAVRESDAVTDAVIATLKDTFYMMPLWKVRELAKEAGDAYAERVAGLPDSLKGADRTKAVEALAKRMGVEQGWPVKRKTTIGDY